jgi:PKD repeat protein
MKNMFVKPFQQGLASTLLLIGVFALNSCGGDEEPAPAPTASFSYEKDGLEVTFTNTSTNAKTYAWDFGDGETSTEQSPVHTYAAYGDYNVKVVATGDGGADTYEDLLTIAKTSPVVIDGTFSDWDNVPVAASSVDGNGGSVQELKIDYDGENIYVMMKGDMKGVYGVFINSDYDGATGATSPNFDYLWSNLGADYYIEGNLVDWGSLQQDDPANPDWGFNVIAESSTILTAKTGESGGKKMIEFKILRSGIPNMSSEKIGLGIKDIDIDAGWTTSGALPAVSQEGVPGVYYTLDFTK